MSKRVAASSDTSITSTKKSVKFVNAIDSGDAGNIEVLITHRVITSYFMSLQPVFELQSF